MKRIFCFLIIVLAVTTSEGSVTVFYPSNASAQEILAAKEIRRYLYLRTDELVKLVQSNGEIESNTDLIVIGQKDAKLISSKTKFNNELDKSVRSLETQQFIIKTLDYEKQRIVLIVGGDAVGTLYGAYRFIEHFGVRFQLHADAIPDKKIRLRLPLIDETQKPLFKMRGLNSWGSHVEGIDLWDANQYKAVFSQIAKMRMNSMVIHSYPAPSGLSNDPHVWVGVPEDVDDDGNVSFSPTTSQWNNQRAMWGYKAKNTGDFLFGGSQLFESDWWGADVMGGQFPVAHDLAGRNDNYNRAGKKFKDAFSFARKLGVKTGLGTEMGILGPSTKRKLLKEGEKLSLAEHGPSIAIPYEVQQRLKAQGKDPKDLIVLQEIYEGIFSRIKKTHPLDYYLLFTQESWYWSKIDNQMFDTLIEEWQVVLKAWEKVNPEFGLATSGWILGPDSDHAAWDKRLPKHVAVSEMSSAYNAPVDEAFGRMTGRDKWAVPWIEEDTPILTPCLWASRVRKDAADALAYGCTGLMTLHWRTRILEPSSAAMAQACWDQSGWNPEYGKDNPSAPVSTFAIDEPVDGPYAAGYIKEGDIGDVEIEGTDEDKIYQSGRSQLGGYRLKVPNGKYRVILKFCESLPTVNSAGARYFDIYLQGNLIETNLDIFSKVGKFAALDIEYDDIEVDNGMLKVELQMKWGWPCLMGLEVYGEGYNRKINVGGEDYKDYEGDLHWYIPTDTFLWGKRGYNIPPRGLNVDDFYADWCLAMFGPEVADKAAKIFTRLDGRIPLISMWAGVNGYCAGGLTPDPRRWDDVSKEFVFVDEFEKLRPLVCGAGNLERFDFWLNNFLYTQASSKAEGTWWVLEDELKKVRKEKDSEQQKKITKEKILPVYKKLVEQVCRAYTLQLETISDIGGIATILNWEGHNNLLNIREIAEELKIILGTDLPTDAIATKSYKGRPRIIVPVLRTLIGQDESLKLKVIVLDNQLPRTASLYYRLLGKGNYTKINLKHISRAVYSVTIPQIQEDFEYYIEAETSENKKIIFPASAPHINQSVVIIPEDANG